MADSWGGSWGTSWATSWSGDGTVVIPIPPVPEEEIRGGTPLRGGKKRHRATILGRKEYEELVQVLLAKAAAKTAVVISSEKAPKPTKRAVVAVAKRATADEATDLKQIWAETAASIAAIEEIDSRQQKLADDLAVYFAKLADEREQEEEDEIALLLS